MRNKIIEMINKGMPLKEISEATGANYNTVRQISVSNNLLKKFSYLTKEQLSKLESLGNNIRALSPLKDDEDAIFTIADYISENTNRKELEDIVKAINDIKSRKGRLISNYNSEMKRINEKLDKVKNRIKNIRDLDDVKKDLDSQFKHIRDLQDKDIRKGYLNLIALKCYDDRLFYSLGKRVNLNLWNKLRRAEAIEPRLNEIKNMQKFIELTINTIKRNNYYKNETKEKNIIEINHLTIENQLKPYLLDLDNEISSYNEQIENLKVSIKKSSEKAIKNYFAEREFRNTFTKNDSLTHAKIQQGGAKWLFNNDCVATIELSKDKYQFDVAGYNSNEEIIILEAKASTSDLRGDKKIVDYMNYCDKLYLVSNEEYVCNAAIEILDERIGVIRLNKQCGFYELMREAAFIGNGDKSLILDINRKNSRYLLFGR